MRARGAPAYQRIKDFMLARIHAGQWGEGDQVPSENALAHQFNVARMTVNRALRELTAEQVLTRVQGVGTFVARTKYETTLVAIRSLDEDIAARGHRHRAQVLELAQIVALLGVADEMQLPRGSRVFYSRVLHFENDEPIQLEARWVNPMLAPDYLSEDFSGITPSQYLVRVAPLQQVEYCIEATLPDTPTRTYLLMSDTEPALVLHRRTWSKGAVASIANLWHPGSRYRFTGYF